MKHIHNRRQSKRLVFIVGAPAVLLVGIGCVLELANVTHFFHKWQTPQHTSNQNTKGEPLSPQTDPDASQSNTDQQNGDTLTDTKGQSDDPVSSSQNLIVPLGNFISVHSVSLNQNPMIGSSCETTTGATCQISFSKDSITKYLKTQTTDDGGATYWTWNPKDLGLSVGSWHVQAKATLGSNTKTADDATSLEVTP